MKIKPGEERVMYQFPAHMNAGEAAWEYMRVVGEAKTERRYNQLKFLLEHGWAVNLPRSAAEQLKAEHGGTIYTRRPDEKGHLAMQERGGAA
jgi:hypothetical protein